ncbi:MAG: FAD/NAD(P)-binding protein, partial [Pseudomonadota bacterium]
MKKRDRELGMGRKITRRDFLHDSTLVALGLTAPQGVMGQVERAPAAARYYPPTKTGLRGSHAGTFEVPHALALEGRSFDAAEPTGEEYDLVVVGGGISGLSTALYYQDRFGQDARILILENHDDFGGHAKRNEYHHDGAMHLAIGGVHNLEYTSWSDNANAMLKRLGIDIEALKAKTKFNYGEEGFGEVAMFFDEETFGRDVLIKGLSLYGVDLIKNVEAVRQMPLSSEARERLERFVTLDIHVMPDLSWEAMEARLAG